MLASCSLRGCWSALSGNRSSGKQVLSCLQFYAKSKYCAVMSITRATPGASVEISRYHSLTIFQANNAEEFAEEIEKEPRVHRGSRSQQLGLLFTGCGVGAP